SVKSFRTDPGMMRTVSTLCSVILLVSGGGVGAQEMRMSDSLSMASLAPQFFAGASGILVGTRVSPGINNRDLTEGYLSQPMLMGEALFPRYWLELSGTIDLEGLTLKRGELNPGIYGEGYIDRRHPHTYLHEIVATWKREPSTGSAISVTGGKGFAPFGTDDPMSRPFVTYPVNHHLAQILERAIVVGAARAGPISLELSRFNGDEPQSPTDLPNSNRLFDSWSGRVTGRFWTGSEMQASFASVISPEVAVGGGLNQKKWSASGRYEREMLYGLAEFAETREYEAGREAFSFNTMLAEASLTGKSGVIAVRAERTERPEEDRLANLFRTPVPPNDLSILGRTRWTTLTANVSHSFSTRMHSTFSPFVEVARAQAVAIDQPSVFDPKSFYGSDVIWSVSAGMRFGFGMKHARMGRYGAALPSGAMKMGAMDMTQ
ncbi:MAG: hypothetical protein ACREIW_04945, partial [Chthoniobacterales bacterium]